MAYSYESNFLLCFLNKNEKKLTRSLNFMFHDMNCVLSLNNSKSGDHIDNIYQIKLK
jgi:hypothetical protein